MDILNKNRLIVSLTTIPSRLKYINNILNNIIRQSRPPDQIYLNIPFRSRKEKILYNIDPQIEIDYPLVKIVRGADLGPITKLIPTLSNEFNPDTLIVTVDDDMEYPLNLLENLLKYSECDPNGAWSGDGWIVGSPWTPWSFYGYIYQPFRRTKVSIIQGCSGCLYRRSFFDLKDFESFNNLIPSNLRSSAYINDDIIISAYLASRGISRWVYPGYRKQTTDISKIEAISGSSIRMFLKFYPLIIYFINLNLFKERQVAPLKRRVGFWILFFGLFVVVIILSIWYIIRFTRLRG